MKKLAFLVFAAALAACAFGAWEAVFVPAYGEVEVAECGKVAAIMCDANVTVDVVRRTWGSTNVVTTNATFEVDYSVTWISGAGTTNAVTNAATYADLSNASARYALVAADTNLTVTLATNITRHVYSVTTSAVPAVVSAVDLDMSVGDFVLPGDILEETTGNGAATVILEH